MESLRDTAGNLGALLEELLTDIDDFDSENWRDVVPKVRSVSRLMVDEYSSLRIKLGLDPDPAES